MTFEMQAELVMRSGEGKGERVILTNYPFVVGRGDADLVIDDSSVSRRHFEIAREGDSFRLKDLGSSNGTYLNGERISEADLKDGDTVRTGQTEFIFSLKRGLPLGSAGTEEEGGKEGFPSLVSEMARTKIEERTWLEVVLASLVRKYGADRGLVAGYDWTSGSVFPMAGGGEDLLRESTDGRVAFSRSIVDEAMRRRAPVITSNAEVDPRFREASSVAKYDINSVMCVPAQWNSRPLGAVYLERSIKKAPFTEEDAAGAREMADLIGVGIMAWKSGAAGMSGTWEREVMERSLGERETARLEAEGGLSSLRKDVREVNVLTVRYGKLGMMMEGRNEEAWRALSQTVTQVNEAMMRNGGAIVSLECAVFGAGKEEKDCHLKALEAAIEAIRIARASVKKMIQEYRAGFSFGAGITTGEALVGFFGGGKRSDYFAFGETVSASNGLALNAQDGEILIDQQTYNKVHGVVTTHRVAPVSVPGVDKQVQAFRVLSL